MQDARITDFWNLACTTVPAMPPDAAYQVWHFGDGAALAQELAELVLRGLKRATAGLLWEAESDPNAMPVVLERFALIYPAGGS